MSVHENIKLLVDGNNAFPEIIRCIENAKSSVHINMFIWRDDEIGNRMARAVLWAANKGAQVYISVDRYGVVLEKSEENKRSFFHKKQSLSEKIKTRTLEILYPMPNTPKRANDVCTPLYNEIMSHSNITVSYDVFKADHSKFYIIDGEILFVGGINIEDKENGSDMQGRVYGDYMAKLEGKEYVDAFLEKLNYGADVSDDYFFGVNLKGGEERFFEMEEKYLEMIESAERELTIVMAYFSPLKRFIKAILDAHLRGVKVRIMLPERANYQNDTNKKTARRLLKMSKGGIEIYFCPRMLHTKLVMNEKMISFGSTNITKKAFGQLSELNLFVKNTESQFRTDLLADVEKNREMSARLSDFGSIKYNRMLAFLEGFLV